MKTLGLKSLLTILVLFSLLSCSKDIYTESKRAYRIQAKELSKELREISTEDNNIQVIESQNFNLRKPQFIIIHHTQQDSCNQTYKTFALKKTQVSAHYIICKNGTVTQMLSDYLRGWHAGKGKWHSITDMNSISLGIELDNNGREAFSEEQINSLLKLLSTLTEKYNIPKENIIGHADWSPGRKVDPNEFFPWKTLAEHGFGLWYDVEKLQNLKLSEHFDSITALRLLGYDTSNLEHAIYSFKLHFDSFDGSNTLTELDKKKLYILTAKD